ncbi:MAG: site-specific DNA-methyltransferase [Bacteroidales bacterium]|nr:site-specific DNA-methyltransferase [Bacteroidales bacterium]
MSKENKFYKALQDVFIGAKIEGKGGFINLMRIKSGYYAQIEKVLQADIDHALEQYPHFRDELFDKLFSFFSRYFTQSGSIYFNSTPFHNNIYEKVYTDEKDVILFWKTQMLYYVKTDRIFKSMPVEFEELKFYFDAGTIENKKANEKRTVIFELKNVREDGTILFITKYSEKGTVTKTADILKDLKKKNIAITEEQLERAFRVFEKQSEVDFFINKNARAFLQEQFKLWSFQYFWDGAKEWSGERVNQLQVLKSIAFRIIDFIAQFEDELVKIWNKPKFVKNSNYVITLDKITDAGLVKKLLEHPGIKEQIKEWQELGIVDEQFKTADIQGDKKFEHLPFDTKYFKSLELEILALFDNLDRQLDGWLIKSENYQALITIRLKFKSKIDLVYIDPPFNTGDDFDYIDNYQDSTWLSILNDRLSLSNSLLKSNGNLYIHLDENANYLGRLITNHVFGKECFKRELIWDIQVLSGYKVKGAIYNWILGHQNILFYSKAERSIFNKVIQPHTLKYLESFKQKDERGELFQVAHGRRIYKKDILEKQKPYGDVWNMLSDLIDIQRPFPEVWRELTQTVDENAPFVEVWNDIKSFQQQPTSNERVNFDTQKPEKLLERIIKSSSNAGGIILDFYAGSGTTVCTSLKIEKRKFIGIELAEHFYVEIIPRLKGDLYNGRNTVVAKENGFAGGGFFKYYELEQYEEALNKCIYNDSDLFNQNDEKAYSQYVFLKDEKMLKALEIDYEQNKVSIDLEKLYPGIDVAETLSNLTGKWIKAIRENEVEFADGSRINTKELDYRLVKPLIWWE